MDSPVSRLPAVEVPGRMKRHGRISQVVAEKSRFPLRADPVSFPQLRGQLIEVLANRYDQEAGGSPGATIDRRTRDRHPQVGRPPCPVEFEEVAPGLHLWCQRPKHSVWFAPRQDHERRLSHQKILQRTGRQ